MTHTDHIPTLTTPRLTLRPFTLKDVVPLHQILQEPNILDYFPTPEAPPKEGVQKIIEHRLAHWKEHGFGWWAMVPNGQSELIGWNGCCIFQKPMRSKSAIY